MEGNGKDVDDELKQAIADLNFKPFHDVSSLVGLSSLRNRIGELKRVGTDEEMKRVQVDLNAKIPLLNELTVSLQCAKADCETARKDREKRAKKGAAEAKSKAARHQKKAQRDAQKAAQQQQTAAVQGADASGTNPGDLPLIDPMSCGTPLLTLDTWPDALAAVESDPTMLAKPWAVKNVKEVKEALDTPACVALLGKANVFRERWMDSEPVKKAGAHSAAS